MCVLFLGLFVLFVGTCHLEVSVFREGSFYSPLGFLLLCCPCSIFVCCCCCPSKERKVGTRRFFFLRLGPDVLAPFYPIGRFWTTIPEIDTHTHILCAEGHALARTHTHTGGGTIKPNTQTSNNNSRKRNESIGHRECVVRVAVVARVPAQEQPKSGRLLISAGHRRGRDITRGPRLFCISNA